MSDSAADLSRFVPGFDFMQALVKGAGAALPSIGQWVAPTLDPEEIDKRIEELRTVQFWLEQNARMLSATIQALEVQRMTLTTLRTMNVQMSDLRDSMMIRPPEPEPEAQAPTVPSWLRRAESKAPMQPEPEPESAPEPEPESAPEPEPESAVDVEPESSAEPEPESAAEPAAHAAPAASSLDAPQAAAVDPMQWWSALTRQFTELAAAAIRDTPAPPQPPKSSKPARTTANASKPARTPAKASKSARTPAKKAKRAAAKKAGKKRAPAKRAAGSAAEQG